MVNRRISGNTYFMLLLFFLFCFLCLTSCTNTDENEEAKEVSVIHRDSSLIQSGLFYNDIKDISYKCFFDFKSLTNLYFCTRKDCDHSSYECNSKQCHPYTFLIGSKQYYMEPVKETDNNLKEILVTYLFESDPDNSGTRAAVKLDGYPLYDLYLEGNTLSFLSARQKISEDQKYASVLFEIVRIDMKDFSVKKIFIKEARNEDYISSGLINQKMILYHRSYDKAINPADYGFKGNMGEFIKDKENYKKYLIALMKVFHEDMLYVDLTSEKSAGLDLPAPLLVYDKFYYYNKKTADDSYQLTAYNFITGEEKTIYDGPVKTLSNVGDTLFFKEGIVKQNEITLQPMIDYDRNICREFSYTLAAGERKEVLSHLPENAKMNIIAEYDDYYIFIYGNIDEGIQERVGYIKKEDYYNGKDNYTLAIPL